MHYANRKHKKAGMSLLKLEKVDFKKESILRDREIQFHNDKMINSSRKQQFQNYMHHITKFKIPKTKLDK